MTDFTTTVASFWKGHKSGKIETEASEIGGLSVIKATITISGATATAHSELFKGQTIKEAEEQAITRAIERLPSETPRAQATIA